MIQLKMASYYDNIDNYHKVDTIVETLLTEHIRRANIHTMQISHRIKTVESTSEKIIRYHFFEIFTLFGWGNVQKKG